MSECDEHNINDSRADSERYDENNKNWKTAVLIQNEFESELKSKKRTITILSIIMILIVIGTLCFIFIAPYIYGKENDNTDNKDKENEDKENAFLISYNNSYFDEIKGTIENSFKIDGEHFDPKFGNVNNGKDYKKNKFNYFDIKIPGSAWHNKIGYNKIIIWLHPGFWTNSNKKKIESLCHFTSEMGIISVAMDYTLLNYEYTDHTSIFRIIDEITACINSVLNYLISKNINIDNIQLSIGGLSGGSHLALLYGYFIKKPIIPIKFIVNIAGPTTLNPEFYMTNVKYNNTLDDLEPDTIEDAIKSGKLKQINNSLINIDNLIYMMNCFIGNKYIEKEIEEIIQEYKIDKNSTKFQKLLNLAELIGSPINYIDKNSPPTINYYIGNDDMYGVAHYSLLKEKYYEIRYSKDVIIYARYNNNSQIFDTSTESGTIAHDEFIAMFNIFKKKYFINIKNNQ